ncbi:AMP-binding protein [Maribacter sp. CXY002]|uniref:AMP-binding protein n=1 Tax=Maribacter luteocoastalis TaxID=3407671 RepID=UPI003B67219C
MAEIHPKFKLNGLALNERDLIEVGYCFIKEGQAFEREIGVFLLNWLDATNEVSVQTSGSTGSPKEIILLKEHMVNSAKATGSYFDLQQGDSALLCLPARYIAGKMMLVRAMVLGLELDTVEPSSSPLHIFSRDYDFCAMVPIQVQNSLSHLSHIKNLIIGGTTVSSSLKKELNRLRVNAFETYGMTETVTHIAVKKLIEDELKGEGIPSLFLTLPGIRIEQDERGCLVINAPNISKTKIVTNDVVKLHSTTEFELLGRIDNVINSGGVKLFPENIERKLSHIIKNPFFVAGIPDEELGEKLILIIEGKGNLEEIANLLKLAKDLGPYETPKTVCFLENFERTENEKIQRTPTLNKVFGIH